MLQEEIIRKVLEDTPKEVAENIVSIKHFSNSAKELHEVKNIGREDIVNEWIGWNFPEPYSVVIFTKGGKVFNQKFDEPEEFFDWFDTGWDEDLVMVFMTREPDKKRCLYVVDLPATTIYK